MSNPVSSSASPKRDFLTALASGFVAALALASSIYNVYLQRQQVKAQVFPRMTFGVSWTGNDWQFVVKNVGVGPADIRQVHVWVDGKPVTSWDAAERALFHGGPISVGTTTPILTMVSPGDSLHAFALEDPDLARAMFNERRRLEVELCYCSTLDDCWSVKGTDESDRPVPVPECKFETSGFNGADEAAIDDYLRSIGDGGTAHPDAATTE